MTTTNWTDHLCELVARHPEYGAGADLSSMTETELWGLYLRLRRLAGGCFGEES